MTSGAARTVALVALTTASLATLLCCVVDTPWTPHVFAAALVVFPVALMLLGASHARPRVGPVALWTLGLLLLLLASSMAGLFWTRGTDAQLLGLPAGVLLLVVGLFLLPLVLTTLGFAASFEDGPSDERPSDASP